MLSISGHDDVKAAAKTADAMSLWKRSGGLIEGLVPGLGHRDQADLLVPMKWYDRTSKVEREAVQKQPSGHFPTLSFLLPSSTFVSAFGVARNVQE